MKVIENELSVMVDVDDTLLMWGMDNSPDAITAQCPYTKEYLRLVPHTRHVELLKQYKGRGFYVTVWSAGGWEWAKTAVNVLNLESFVDEVRTKPLKYMDDLQAREILGTRVYLDYKDKNVSI